MASITKTFVATSVMQLVEAGKINLDAPVVQYLPYFHLADDRYHLNYAQFWLRRLDRSVE
jgi:CubicO group peptidase (beta-lactamase class C family)